MPFSLKVKGLEFWPNFKKKPNIAYKSWIKPPNSFLTSFLLTLSSRFLELKSHFFDYNFFEKFHKLSKGLFWKAVFVMGNRSEKRSSILTKLKKKTTNITHKSWLKPPNSFLTSFFHFKYFSCFSPEIIFF